MIPESFIEELKYSSDIESVVSSYVSLKRKGRTLTGLCPFHNEKTPSFTVYPDNGSYYCFGCQSGGDVITFVRQIENLEYIEALRLLAQRAGMALPEDTGDDLVAKQKKRVLELNRAAARFFHSCLKGPAGREGLAYLTGRGLAPKTITKFGLGFAPESWDMLRNHLKTKGFSEEEMLAAAVVAKGRNGSTYDLFRNRVIFPIIDLRGNVIGFGGRIMEGGKGPKYLNSSDTPVFKKSRNLYALNFAKAAGSDRLLLAEGYMDVIAIHQAGFENVVATLGTALTQEQARLISQYAKKVTIAYDSDGAGQNAAKRAINLFAQIDVQVSVLEIEGAKDPDEYIKLYGALRFGKLIESGKSAISYEIEKLRARYALEDPEQRVVFIGEFCELMAGIEGDLQRDVYLSEVAREIDVGKERLISTVNSIRKRRAGARKRRDAHNLRPYVQDKSTNMRQTAPPKGGLAGVVAEQKLITMMLQNPDYYDDIRSKITAEDFVDPTHAAIWRAMEKRLAAHQVVQPIHLSGELDGGQMAKLSAMLVSSVELQFDRRQVEDYTQAILRQKQTKSTEEVAGMGPEEYARYITSLAAKKK